MTNLPILSISILLPLISAIYITIFVGHSKVKRKQLYAMYIAVLSATFSLIAATYLLFSFDPKITGFQFIEHYSWISAIGLDIHLGIDGFSVYFIFLTSLLTLICIIASIFSISEHIKEYLLCFLLLEAFCIGVFSAINLLLFYIFFEMILIPMYFIIGIWGGKDRVYATLKFFLYTFFGSVFLLISLIYIFGQASSFNMLHLVEFLPTLNLETQQYLWCGIFISLAIKVPMVPVHTWLPDAHVQAPTAGSVMLAGILLKLGGYALLRVLLPMLPGACEAFAPYVMYLSAAAIIYASLVALVQEDMKKMIAYSSVAHMGYVTAGIFSFTFNGISGAVFQMVSHGLISAVLFLVVGMLYERCHTKEISAYGGVAQIAPKLASVFMIAMLGSVGLPGTSGFIGELLSIMGTFESNPIVGIICASGVVFGAIYMLQLYRRTMFGVAQGNITELRDLQLFEKISVAPLIIMIIYFGLQPNNILLAVSIPTTHLLELFNTI